MVWPSTLKEAHRQTSQLRFAVVHWRIRRKWSDGSYHCFRPWVAWQRGTITLVLLVVALCCLLCFVSSFSCSFFLSVFFVGVLIFFLPAFSFVSSSCLLVFFFLFFLSCCCCCYGWWWHLYLTVMLTVSCRFWPDLQRSMDEKAKTDKQLGLTLFLSLAHGHCVVTLVVGLCWLWQFCSFKVLPRICIFPVSNGVQQLGILNRSNCFSPEGRVTQLDCVQLDGTGNRLTQNSWILSCHRITTLSDLPCKVI